MKNSFLFLITFLMVLNSFGQLKDTITLKEVTILSKNKTVKHVRTKGASSSLTGNSIKSVLSKVDAIPDGKLSTLKLFFNSSESFLIKDSNKNDYRILELGLLIYDCKADGTPGDMLTDKTLRFTLHPNENGTIELDLKPLFLNTSPTMFFGVELLDKQIGKDFKIMTNCTHENSKLIFLKTWNNDVWSSSSIPCAMKLDVGVITVN